MSSADGASSYWQAECSDVRERISRLLELGQWTDCEFRVGAYAASVRAHRLVLAVASPVFERMLYGPMASEDKAEPIDVPDMQVEAFNALLRYIYTDHVTITSCTDARALYYAGEKYMLPKLKSESLPYLHKNLSSDNAAITYEFAKLFGEKQLADKCLQVIKDDTLAVLMSDSFLELQMDTVTKIFSLEPLNVDSELDLYDAAVRYTSYSVDEKQTWTTAVDKSLKSLPNRVCGSEPVDETNSSVTTELGEPDNGKETEEKYCPRPAAAKARGVQDKIGDNITTCDPPELPVREAVKQIRFLAVDPQQFADHDFTLILTQSEILAILLNLNSKTTQTPMPSGFSKNRESRIRAKMSLQLGLISTRSDGDDVITVFRMKRDINRIDHTSPKFNVREHLDCTMSTRISYAGGHTCFTGWIWMYTSLSGCYTCPTQLTVRVLSHIPGISPVCTTAAARYFTLNGPIWINNRPWNELTFPENNYVTDNCVILEVEVRAGPLRAGA